MTATFAPAASSALTPFPAALVLSIEPEVRHALTGKIVADPDAVEEALVEIGEVLEGSSGTHLVVFNCSTLRTNHRRAVTRGDPDDYVTTIGGLNLALVRAAQRHDLSIVDVDRLVAECGEEVVLGPLEYHDEIYAAAASEVVRILRERGMVDRSTAGAGDVRRLALPGYDRRISQVRIVAWHKGDRDYVEYGDAVVDVVAEGLRAVLDPDSAMAGQRRNRMRKKNRDLMLSIRAGEDGVIRRILAPPGTTVAVGETIGIVAADLAVDVSSAEALHNARDFRLVAAPVSPGDGHPEEDA